MSDGSWSGGSPWGRREDHEPYLVRARAFLAANNLDAAIREASRAYELQPEGFDAILALDILADAYWDKDEWQKTASIGEQMLAIEPALVHGYVQCGRGAIRRKDWQRFDALAADALERFPHAGVLMQMNAQRWLAAGAFENAEVWIRRALEIAPDNIHLLADLASILARQHRSKEARQIIDRMLEIDPAGSVAMSTATMEAYEDDRFGDAALLATLTLERDPGNDIARVILARSRIFGNPLMRPFWAMRQVRSAWFAMAVALIAIVVTRMPWPLFALMLYWTACMIVGVIVEKVYSLERVKKHATVTIKDY